MRHESMRSTLRITKALSDIQRVRILMMLRTGELCVCQIIAVLGLAPSTVSKHLSILSAAGLVDSRKDGRWAYFRLPQGAALKAVKPVLKWLREALKGDDSVVKDARDLEAALMCPPKSLSERQRKRSRQPVASVALATGWRAGQKLCLPHDVAAPGGMIGASNFFELSVAVAISLFGASSPVVLATIVGVLVEVPVMLHLVKIANRTTRWFPAARSM